MIRNLGIGKYLLFAMAALATVSLGFGVLIYLKASTNVNRMSEITGKTAKLTMDSQHLLATFASLHARYSPLISENEVDALERLVKEIDEDYAKVERTLSACGESCKDYSRLYTDYKIRFATALDRFLKSGDRPSAIHAMLTQLDPQWQKVIRKFDFDRNELAKATDTAVADSTWIADEIKVIIILMTLASAAISMVVGLIIRRAIVHHISHLATSLLANSAQLMTSSAQLSTSSDGLSHAVLEQSSALQETMSSLHEMKITVERNAEYAKTSVDKARDSQQTAESGSQAMGELQIALAEVNGSNESIRTEIETSSREISKIVSVIDEIQSRTKVINEIVFQTKLLSFNASVEAARAGEHGKGFAVVAEEIGNLAKMSGQASEDIAAMLEKSIEIVNTTATRSRQRVSSSADENKKKMENGLAVAQRCNAVFVKIAATTDEVSKMIGEISTASHDQTIGVSQIALAMTQFEKISHQNSNVAGETAAAAQEISGQAGSLNDSAGNLKSFLVGNSRSRNH